MPSIGQTILLVASIAFFAIAALLSIARLRGDRPPLRRLIDGAMIAGIVAALGVLIWHQVGRGNWLPLEDNFDALVSLGLLLALFVFYMQHTRPLLGLDWFIMPIVILLMTAAAVFGRTHPHEYVASAWSWVHRLTTYGGAVAFAVAGAVGAMYLVASYRLRRKSPLQGPILGSLERLEHLTMTSAALGFSLLTIGTITGFLWLYAERHDTAFAGGFANSKVLLACGVWIVYALVLHSPFNPSFRGRRVAMLSVFGFVLMVGALVAAQFMPEGTR